MQSGVVGGLGREGVENEGTGSDGNIIFEAMESTETPENSVSI